MSTFIGSVRARLKLLTLRLCESRAGRTKRRSTVDATFEYFLNALTEQLDRSDWPEATRTTTNCAAPHSQPTVAISICVCSIFMSSRRHAIVRLTRPRADDAARGDLRCLAR